MVVECCVFAFGADDGGVDIDAAGVVTDVSPSCKNKMHTYKL